MTNEIIKVGTFFSGIGSSEKALERLKREGHIKDYELEFFSEIDKNAIKSYCAIHNVDERLNLGSITNVKGKDLPYCDLWIGWFPCQDISCAGKMRGFDFTSSTRSSLGWEMIILLKEVKKKPKYVIFENVAMINSKKFKDTLKLFKEDLMNLGYTLYDDLLCAKDYGIPQTRTRYFLVAILSNKKRFNFPKKIESDVVLKDLLEEYVDEKYYLTNSDYIKKDNIRIFKHKTKPNIEYELATRINTNGWNVTKENLESWLKNGLDQIVLSIYGLDENSIIETRGNRLIFDKSMRAVEVIKELKKKYKFIFIIQTIIMKENYKQMPQLLNYAIDSDANLFWPSYLEDAINLPEVRLSCEEIYDFKNNIIPKMKEIINKKVVDDNIKNNIMKSLDNYYNDGTVLYQYHKDNENCHWSGKHFTFYPNGTVDPCPGHEYFKSEYQYKINYDEIDEFMKLENLNKCKNICFDYCKYCPQGVHHEISFMPVSFNEHDSKEEI